MQLKWVSVIQFACVAGLGWLGVGCATPGRPVSISTDPADALIVIDGVDALPAPINQRFLFDGQTHKVLASRFGYIDQERLLKEDTATGRLLVIYKDDQGREITETTETDLKISLPHKRRKVTFTVTPVAGMVLLDGRPLAANPVSQVSKVIEFDVDAKNNWLPHSVTAKRTGFQDISAAVQWIDPQPLYTLTLEPFRKDLRIITRPPGAEIFVNGEPRGAEPVSIKDFAFPVDPDTNAYLPQKITAKKPGFDPIERTIGWDNGQTDYTIDLTVKSKSIRIVTDPPGAAVTLDGAELGRDGAGASSATLSFAPIDDKGTPKVYLGAASRKDVNTEWEAAPFQVGWDDGRRDYTVVLSEVKSRPLALIRARFTRGERGWALGPETLQTVSPRDISESGTFKVTPVFRLGAGSSFEGLATSPDASLIVFAPIAIGADGRLHSQIQVLDVDGPAAGPTARPRLLGDDKGVVLTPSFSPDGKYVLFSSDRDGRRAGIWSIPVDGSGGPTRLTGGAETIDLWPSLDSLPHARLFYQGLLDSRPDPRLFFVYARAGQGPAGEGTDMAQPGSQPQVSPQADRVLFAAVAPGMTGTGHRRLYTIPDNGGEAAELTRSAFDDFDPAWSKDGSRIAFVSNRPSKGSADEKGAKAGDFNIWVLNAANPQAPLQEVTSNPSWDDSPAWDATGSGVYFRSNRGGTWGIWKAALR
jgi:hypothetical protein